MSVTHGGKSPDKHAHLPNLAAKNLSVPGMIKEVVDIYSGGVAKLASKGIVVR